MKPNQSKSNVIRFPTEEAVCATMFVAPAPTDLFAEVKAFAVPMSVRILGDLQRRIDLAGQLGREASIDNLVWRDFEVPVALVSGTRHPLVHETILDLQDAPVIVTEAIDEFDRLDTDGAERWTVAAADALSWGVRIHDETIRSVEVTSADLAYVATSRFMVGRDRQNGRSCR